MCHSCAVRENCCDGVDAGEVLAWVDIPQGEKRSTQVVGEQPDAAIVHLACLRDDGCTLKILLLYDCDFT